MNRINQMIDLYATNAASALIQAKIADGFGYSEEVEDLLTDMMVQREELHIWIKISQAVRGWQL